MSKIILCSDGSLVELSLQLHQEYCFVRIETSSSESIFAREAIRSHFGGYYAALSDLLNFLNNDPRIQLVFNNIYFNIHDLDQSESHNAFGDLPLSEKLLVSGIIDQCALLQLHEEYNKFRNSLDFIEFISIRSFIPTIVLDFFVDPSFISDDNFNVMLLEERLYFLQLVEKDVCNTLKGMRSAFDNSFSPFEFLRDSSKLSDKTLTFFSCLTLIDGRCVTS